MISSAKPSTSKSVPAWYFQKKNFIDKEHLLIIFGKVTCDFVQVIFFLACEQVAMGNILCRKKRCGSIKKNLLSLLHMNSNKMNYTVASVPYQQHDPLAFGPQQGSYAFGPQVHYAPHPQSQSHGNMLSKLACGALTKKSSRSFGKNYGGYRDTYNNNNYHEQEDDEESRSSSGEEENASQGSEGYDGDDGGDFDEGD
jgi:hypothetical protein